MYIFNYQNDGLKTVLRAFVRYLFKHFGDLFSPVHVQSEAEADGEPESQPTASNEGENDNREDAMSDGGDNDRSELELRLDESMQIVEEHMSEDNED